MFTPKQNVTIKPWTHHNMSDYPKYALVVRMMAGNEFVILNTGDEYDYRVHVKDVEPV